MLTPDQIEEEVQARVEFKMNQFLTAIKNMANANWHLAFQSGRSKYANYWEAFGEIEKWFKKELNTPTPSDHMADDLKRKKKRDVIDNIKKEINQFGLLRPKDEERIHNFLAREIENLQN